MCGFKVAASTLFVLSLCLPQIARAEDPWTAQCRALAGSPSEPGSERAGRPFDKVDPERAVPICQLAITQDASKENAYRLGRALQKAEDHAAARSWYEDAARQNYAPAQHSLGVMYEHGLGGEQDDAEAVSWYRRAAEQGDAGAQVRLGNLYLQGPSRNDRLAARWYAAAASQGDPQGQLMLGALYADGRGVPPDKQKADDLFERAARNGTASVAAQARQAQSALAKQSELAEERGDEKPGTALVGLLTLFLLAAIIADDPSDGERKGDLWCETDFEDPDPVNKPTICSNQNGRWEMRPLHPCYGVEGWCDG